LSTGQAIPDENDSTTMVRKEGIIKSLEDVTRRLTDLEKEKSRLLISRDSLERELQNIDKKIEFSESSKSSIIQNSSADEKISLFCKLFRGRRDVFPTRWENRKSGRTGYSPACSNEWQHGICAKPKVKCGDCPNQSFIPLTETIIAKHLRGRDESGREFIAGIYPLQSDETCWLIAADFDKETWIDDTRAFMETCRIKGVNAALERSRSGKGGHIWIFFEEPIPARIARQMGASLLTETMERRPEIGFSSYDRFFPNQDTMPLGGFGNLIALPLQKSARELGNSVFVDDNLTPFDDQWAFLSSIKRNPSDVVFMIAEAAESSGTILGVRMPVDDEFAHEPWKISPSRRSRQLPAPKDLPEKITIVVADQIYVDKTQLPPLLVAQLIRLAAFQNPEFYRAQAMRLPIYDKPRIVSCAELHPLHISLPRGCYDEVISLIRGLGVDVVVDDQQQIGEPLANGISFQGSLREPQSKAFHDLISHDCGVLAATTAFGKTVVAAALIAERQRNTLILVHRRELLAQWIERLKSFLNIPSDSIGMIGSGKRKPTNIIDVALIQSLVKKGEVDDIVANYGHLVVDECHHLSAVSFELVAKRAKAKFVLGLSATVARKDGHHPIIFMQCGPVRHRVDAKTQAAERGITHRVHERITSFSLPHNLTNLDRPPLSEIYASLAQDDTRNDLIFNDVLCALEKKRSPLLLTERKDHLFYLQQRFQPFVKNIALLCGGLSSKDRKLAEAALAVPEEEERLVIATGRYIGEGFDDARLDTLFLTMPISWKGILAQYVGRLHRQHARKQDVLVYDYVDTGVPVLARMAIKRRIGYRNLGYSFE
jgi:superfamily II DNA or RNA helicase